jgi:hypothetical protein
MKMSDSLKQQHTEVESRDLSPMILGQNLQPTPPQELSSGRKSADAAYTE